MTLDDARVRLTAALDNPTAARWLTPDYIAALRLVLDALPTLDGVDVDRWVNELEREMFPHQESEFEQESFTEVGRERVASVLRRMLRNPADKPSGLTFSPCRCPCKCSNNTIRPGRCMECRVRDSCRALGRDTETPR